MTADRLYKLCLLASVAVSIIAYAYAEPNVSLAALALAAVGLGWWLTEGPVKFKCPTWATYLIVLAIVARAGSRVYIEGLNVAVFCEFLTLVLVYKIWDHARARDQGQILTLCAFLGLGAILTDTSLVLGLLLALLVPVLLAAVMLFQVRPDERLALGPRGAASDRGPGKTPRLARAFIIALILLWVGSGVVFVYFPREIGFGAFGRWGQPPMQTGYTGRVELGSGGLISESQETALELELRDGDGAVVGGPGQVFYLRGAVLDQYNRDTGSWARGALSTGGNDRGRDVNINEIRKGLSFSNAPIPPGSILDQTIIVRDGTAGPIFTIWRPATVSFASPVGVVTPHQFDLTITHGQLSGPLRYTVRSNIGELREGRRRDNPQRTDVSFASPPIHEAAVRILQDQNLDPDPAARPFADDATAADAIEAYLRDNFAYTLDLKAAPLGQDPIEWFLTEARRGHCEYFASAMTALCRSVGIEARVVTGYVATEWDDTAQKYIVRESNAHAWVEARVPGRSWRTFDPTPPADLRRVHEPKQDLVSRIRRLFDSAESRWARDVVGYGTAQRQSFPGTSLPVIGWMQSTLGTVPLPERPHKGRNAVSELRRAIVSSLGWTLLAVATLAAIRISRRLWRNRVRRRPVLKPALADDPDLRFYPALLAILDRRGIAKPESRPPLLHADRLTAADPALAGLIAQVASLYYKSAFGGIPLTTPERRLADDLVRQAARSGGPSRQAPPRGSTPAPASTPR